MIVDAATYLGPWPFREIEGKPAGLARMRREFGVAAAVVSPLDGLFQQHLAEANGRLLKRIAGKEGLFAAPLVSLRMADWRERIDEYAANPQVRAIRLAPSFHGYAMSEAKGAAERAAKRGLAVAVQLRLSDERFHPQFLELPATPLAEVVALAAETPKVRWVASAARLAEMLPLAGSIRGRRNLWLDTSHVDGLECMTRACRALGAERLLFSTCWPFFYAKSAHLKLEEAQLPARDAQRVMGGNAVRAFRLRMR